MHKEGFYSSGEFAKKANVTVRTIRYYDKQNILKPSYVTDTGVRFYTDSDFTRLQQILLLKYLGFSLDDIKNMTIGDSDYNILKNSLHLQLKLIQDKIAQMELVKNAIEDTSGNGKKLLLASQVISHFSSECSDTIYNNLEKKIISYSWR